MERNNKVCEAILNYLCKNKVNYGIMLTGKWGSGKTYFWKNVLEKKVYEKDFSVIYVSVNGLASTEALSRKIFMEMAKCKSKGVLSQKSADLIETITDIANPIMKSIGTAVETAGNAIGLTSDLLHLEIKTENILDIMDLSSYVICVDDIERYEGKIEELMGFCNNLLEHRKAHLVFIANEEKIDDSFRTIKEKLIGKTVQCNLDSRTIIENLLEQASEKNHEATDFMKKHLDVILDVMQRSGEQNYRPVKVLIGDFQDVYGKFEGLPHSAEELETAWKSLLKFMMAAGFEILAKGITSEDIMELKDPSHAGLKDLVAAVGNKNSGGPSYFFSFKRKYYSGYPLEREFFPSVISLITEGVFDKEELKKELMLFHKNEPSVCELVISGKYREMADDQFEQNVKGSLLGDIEKGNVQLHHYRPLFKFFVMFIQMGLIDITVGDLKDKFLSGIEKIRDADSRELPEWNPIDTYVGKWFSNVAPDYLPAYEEINEATNAAAAHLMRDRMGVAQSFMDELRRDFKGAMKLATPNMNGKYIEGALFLDTSLEEVYDILRIQTNTDIQEFRQMIENRLNYGNKEGCEADNRFLLELAKHIRGKISGVGGRKLSEALLLELADDIEKSRRLDDECAEQD